MLCSTFLIALQIHNAKIWNIWKVFQLFLLCELHTNANYLIEFVPIHSRMLWNAKNSFLKRLSRTHLFYYRFSQQKTAKYWKIEKSYRLILRPLKSLYTQGADLNNYSICLVVISEYYRNKEITILFDRLLLIQVRRQKQLIYRFPLIFSHS